MTATHGFELMREQSIAELATTARQYRHLRTGAKLLSLANNDENKFFGVAFATPCTEPTSVTHILEHSVLCGSKKYPIKDPMVALLKSSVKTYLNAETHVDMTSYQVASQNLRDFYNLIDVWLDAVFFPRLLRQTFQQEGWHYELGPADGSLSLSGVVFNETKGAYSSPIYQLMAMAY